MPRVVVDPLSGRRLILAPERARRGVPPVLPGPDDPEPCDFCAGREDRTPPETDREEAEGGGWLVRSVPNLYPAVAVHEVVVHSPGHHDRFEDLAHGARLIGLYQRRLRAHAGRPVVVVWNRGRAAGASRTHEHGQIFWLDEPAPALEREVSALGTEPCLLCGYAQRAELAVTDGVVANPAPLVAHELLVIPEHGPDFAAAASGWVADRLASAIGRLRRAFGDGVPFNVVIHTAGAGFHWHAHLYPRLTTWGGLELGGDLPIVAADPVASAEMLRGG